MDEDTRQRAMKHSVTLPLLGILALLKAWEAEPGLVLNSVREELNRCWARAEYLSPFLKSVYKREISDLLKTVDAKVNDFHSQELLGL